MIGDNKTEKIRIETHRSGVFTFQVGVDLDALNMIEQRVHDAQLRFKSVPSLPNMVNAFHEEVLASSIHGTNTIEGGTLTLEETKAVLKSSVETKIEKEIRVKNISAAYDKAIENAKVFVGIKEIPVIEESMIKELHFLVTNKLTDEPRNIPGEYRKNKKGEITKIGSQQHGGVYVPPKCYDDIKMLIDGFLEWINSEEVKDLPPIVRAPLAHYYFERIHPFWDGNGRVGRVLEAYILRGSGFKYAPFAMAKYYLENIDEYFKKFNEVRSAEENNEKYPNTIFINFFLTGLLQVINQLHDRMNYLLAYILYENKVNTYLQQKDINIRQFTIINNLLPQGIQHKLKDVQSKPWFKGLYEGLTSRTEYRDIKKLTQLGLIEVSQDKIITVLVVENAWD